MDRQHHITISVAPTSIDTLLQPNKNSGVGAQIKMCEQWRKDAHNSEDTYNITV